MNTGGQNLWPLLLSAIGQTLEMVLATLVIGGIAGLVLGTLLYASRPGNLLANRAVFMVLNLMVNIVRPIPFIIFITTVLPLTVRVTGTSYGTRAVIFPMAVMATFATSRIVEQNLVALDPGVIEAARAMGAGPLRIIWTVVVREALAPLILGFTFLFVAITDMSAMAGAVSGGGLGDFALQYGYQRYNYAAMGIIIGVIVVIVQLAQLSGNKLARRVLRR
jgi:D-methionine transport system permease protein